MFSPFRYCRLDIRIDRVLLRGCGTERISLARILELQLKLTRRRTKGKRSRCVGGYAGTAAVKEPLRGEFAEQIRGDNTNRSQNDTVPDQGTPTNAQPMAILGYLFDFNPSIDTPVNGYARMTQDTTKSNDEIFKVAAGMLFSDLAFAALAVLALSLPRLASLVSDIPLSGSQLPVTTVTHIIDLGALCLLFQRWLRRLSMPQRFHFSTPYLVKSVILGLLMWAVPSILLSAPLDATMGTLLAVAAAVLGAAAVILFRYAFILTTLFIPTPFKRQLELARLYTSQNPWLVGNILATPLVLACLYSVTMEAFSPDGRHQIVIFLQALAVPIFWILASYNFVAAALVALPEAQWHTLSLDPYRQARLTTLAMTAPEFFSSALAPRKARWLLLVALLVGLGTYLRLLALPPAAQISLMNASSQGTNLELVLRLEDSQYQMRGLRPIFFALAGEHHTIISQLPERAWIEEDPAMDARFGITPRTSALLHLQFRTSRSEADLRRLEDLYLWYKQVRMVKIQIAPPNSLPTVKGQQLGLVDASPE